MEQTGSTKVLFANELAPLLKPLQALVPSVRVEALPALQEMLDSNPSYYEYSKSFEDARNDPIAVLHSSGSTGEYSSNFLAMNFVDFSFLNRYAKANHHDSWKFCCRRLRAQYTGAGRSKKERHHLFQV